MLRVHYSIHDDRRRGSFSSDGKNRDGGKYDCAVRILILALQSVRVLYGHEFCRNRRDASHLYTQDEPPICCHQQLVLTSIVSLDMACRFHLPAVHRNGCVYIYIKYRENLREMHHSVLRFRRVMCGDTFCFLIPVAVLQFC